MKPFEVSPNAVEDLEDIWSCLADKAGEAVAADTISRLVEGFSQLAESPGIGHRRSDLTKLPLHFFFVEPYLIVYERERSPLPIHAVIHGSRDIRKVLHERKSRE